jgi:DNA modification methylase
VAERFSVHHGSMLDYLPTLAEGCIDACVSDPPYELGFMGRKWDKSGIAFQPETWAEVLRVLKPGSHLIAFGGTRTFHRIACAIEDAGFDIRDSLAWLHGQGFPKSLSITDKIGTALKPAFEPIIVARKPCDGTIKETFLKHGTGGLNIGACRIAHAGSADLAAHQAQVAAIKARGGSMENSWKNSSDLSGANDVTSDGRWPPNALLSHSDECERVGSRAVKANPTWDTPNRETESAFTGSTVSQVRHGDGDTEEVPVWECVEGCPVRELDAQVTTSKGGGFTNMGPRRNDVYGTDSKPRGDWTPYPDQNGTASRFFPQFQRSELDDIAPFLYAAKPSRAERDNGLDYFRHRSGAEVTGSKEGQARLNSPRSGAGRNEGARNVHPTVKGIELMRWLVRLVTPPGGLVLDPFTGSGTTGVAAMLEGLRFCGCEMNDTDEEPFVSIATARMRHVLGLTTVPRESIRATEPPRQGALF